MGSGAPGVPGAPAVNLVEGEGKLDPGHATAQLHLCGAEIVRGHMGFA